ncbi:protease inhibitor I42 family protein [Mycolicibacterium sp. XJ870]
MTSIEVGEQDTVTAHVGDTLVIRLAEAPSTGFRWTIEVTGTAVSVTSDTHAGDPAPRPGAEGQRVFVLAATGPGDADVSLRLSRVWDPASESDFRRIHVTVAE